MNLLIRNSFSQILRRWHPTAPRQRRLIDLCSSSVREFVTLPRVRPLSTLSPLHLQSRRHFVLRWYHDPRKVAVATAITLSATVMAACIRYDREIVPCTYRSHLVIYSDQEERDLADLAFAKEKAELAEKNMIVDPSDPRVDRVRFIVEKIVHAAHRGLGIYDSNDAPMLRVTEKQQRRKWGKAQPHTSHLSGLNWELTLVSDSNFYVGFTPSGKIMVNTGLFDWFETDGEIAAIIAHEVGHLIARHLADITNIHPVVRSISSRARRVEIEADYIGILLLGAAGFHPHWALVFMRNLAKFEEGSLTHPSPKKRFQLLSEAKTMKEAMELYREVVAMDKVTDMYFRLLL